MSNDRADVVIVGAGIIGLAHAYAAARRGLSVVVFERGHQASGASVRNFGTIWPIGQPAGVMHQLALKSRGIWLDLLERAGVAHFSTGSLHVAYREDEADVGREFADLSPALGYECEWLDATAALERSPAIRPQGLVGALWSPTEISIDPRAILAWFPKYLAERYDVQFHFGSVVTDIDRPIVRARGVDCFANSVIVCSGDDCETLYPELLQSAGLTRCKLQMMRTPPQPNGWHLGPSLASGLTLQHYANFRVCATLDALKRRIAEETPELNAWGIHILVSQTAAGEVTIGDSHEYGKSVDVFDNPEIDRLITRHARQFLSIPDWTIAQRWHGVYAKHPDRPFVALSPEPGVRVVTGLGGAGMTLSFGLAEQMVQDMEHGRWD